MWAKWVLGTSFLILILTGWEIVPQWGKPYPESAMFRALLVVGVALGWLVGIVPVAVSVYRGEMDWIAVPGALRWVIVLGAHVLMSGAALGAIGLGTGRNAPIVWKALALIAGFLLPLVFGAYVMWLLEPSWRAAWPEPAKVHRMAMYVFAAPILAGMYAWVEGVRDFLKWFKWR